MGLKVKFSPRGKYGENTYIITDEASGYKAIIDPGYIGDDIRNEIGDVNLLKYVLLTHGHDDHYLAASDYLSEYSEAVFAAPLKEKPLLSACPEPQKWLSEGDTVTLGDTGLRVIETPGHTAGGICFATDKELFSGDTLFRLSVGRTDLPTGDWDTLVKTIQDKLYALDEDIIVFPGHGSATTIGYEKRANPFV